MIDRKKMNNNVIKIQGHSFQHRKIVLEKLKRRIDISQGKQKNKGNYIYKIKIHD